MNRVQSKEYRVHSTEYRVQSTEYRVQSVCRSDQGVTSGSYSVALPDGRLQTVSYTGQHIEHWPTTSPSSLHLHIRHLDEFVPPSVFFAVFVLLFLSLSLKISFIFFSHISGRSSFRCFNLILSLRCCVVTQYFWYCYFFLLYDGSKLSCPKLYRDVCVLFCVRSCCSCCMVIVSSSVACLNSFLC